jgi:hypothetical protein
MIGWIMKLDEGNAAGRKYILERKKRNTGEGTTAKQEHRLPR